MEVNCNTCGTVKKVYPSTVKEFNFCNHKCYAKFKSQKWKAELNPNWVGGDITFTCECGVICTRKRYGTDRDSKQKFCSNKCSQKHFGLNHRGKNHPMWKGVNGKTGTPIRRMARYKDWVKSIFERDNFTCQTCFKKGGDLHAHHKVKLADMINSYVKLHGSLNVDDDIFYDIENGITLCKPCHRLIHSTKSDELLEILNGQSAAKP